MFTFDLVNDFHTEMNLGCNLTGERSIKSHWKGAAKHYWWEADKQSDYLVLAGDNANTIENAISVIEEARQHYKHVLFTDGNHEHYQGEKTVWENRSELQKYSRSVDNVTYLTGANFYQVDDVAFVGANGWYDWVFGEGDKSWQIHAWQSYSNDSRCIKYPEDMLPDRLAAKDAFALAMTVETLQDEKSIKHIVVITHTVPIKNGVHSDTYNDSYGIWNSLSGSYGNSLMNEVLAVDRDKKIKVWGFGHTHFFKDFTENGVRFVSNPRGYSGEQRDGGYFTGLQQIGVY